MEVFLVDGTYELFRHYDAVPSARDKQGQEVGAVRGVLSVGAGNDKGRVTLTLLQKNSALTPPDRGLHIRLAKQHELLAHIADHGW